MIGDLSMYIKCVLFVCTIYYLKLLVWNPFEEGMTFGRNSRDPKYTIEFHSVDSAFHTVS